MPTNSSGTTTTRGEHTCSFCGKSQASVRRLIAGPGRVFICDECVRLCQQIITEENTQATARPDLPPKGLSPKEIAERLDERPPIFDVKLVSLTVDGDRDSGARNRLGSARAPLRRYIRTQPRQRRRGRDANATFDERSSGNEIHK